MTTYQHSALEAPIQYGVISVSIHELTMKTLPFVIGSGDGAVTNFWSPKRTGDYRVDCAFGRECADALLKLMRETANPVLFGSVISAIVRTGEYDAVEIGFCSRLGIELSAPG